MKNAVYLIGQGPKYYTFPPFNYTRNSMNCSDVTFTYKALFLGSESLPQFLKFDPFNRVLALNATSESDNGIYDFQIIGKPSFGFARVFWW